MVIGLFDTNCAQALESTRLYRCSYRAWQPATFYLFCTVFGWCALGQIAAAGRKKIASNGKIGGSGTLNIEQPRQTLFWRSWKSQGMHSKNCEGRLAGGKYALDAIGSNRINQQYTESDHVHLWNGFAICRNEAEIVCVREPYASELLQLSENDGGDGKQTKRITKNVWHRSGMVFAQALANVHMRYYRRTYPKSIYCQL